MNVSITEGLDLMPPEFADGLGAWSSGDGTPGAASYDGAANASLKSADADFDGCLQLLKTETVQKLRWFGQTPMRPGLYLRVRTRVKATAGVIPEVRIAAYAADAGGAPLPGLVQVGPSVALGGYGEVVEVSDIVAASARPGVDMAWGTAAAYGHFGLDLTGGTGGTVRIDDISIEDVSGAFLGEVIDAVDLRDYGALGDGVTDDRAAFVAADAAAAGRTLMVPEGVYRVGSSLTLQSKVRFEGRLDMDDAAHLVLTRNFDLPSYVDAFGDEAQGFRKGFQALLHAADHDAFDLAGRRVDISAPLDMAAAAGDITTFETPRALRNGQIYALASTAWDSGTVTLTGAYDPQAPETISGIATPGQIEVGALVTGAGVGREVYVRAVDEGAGSVTLSRPLFGPAASQSYSFTRFRYALDFSGFSRLSHFTLDSVSFSLLGRASGVMLAPDGEGFALRDCGIDRPADRAVTSPGAGCTGLTLDRCRFASDEAAAASSARSSVGINVNADRAKLRHCRFDRFGLGAMLSGRGHLVIGNAIDQGDGVAGGALAPGLVLAVAATGSVVSANAIDDCYIEWTNEHDATPDAGVGASFGGLTVTGNTFAAADALASFHFIEVKPYGTGHHLADVAVTNNLFRIESGSIERVDGVDTTHAALDPAQCVNLTFGGNGYAGIDVATASPALVLQDQNSAQATWVADLGGVLPFGGLGRSVVAVTAEGPILDAASTPVAQVPHVLPDTGAGTVEVVWPVACSGTVLVTVRADRPV